MDGWDEAKNRAKDVINFVTDDEVYVALVIARKKNNPLLSTRLIHREVLTKNNWEQNLRKLYVLLKHYKSEDQTISGEDCNLYLTVNPRSTKKGIRNLKIHMAEWDYENNYDYLSHFVNKWVSCLQKKSARSRKQYYIIDIDSNDNALLSQVMAFCMMKKYNAIPYDTRNGFHILLPPFTINELYDTIGDDKRSIVEVKTDDCLLLKAGNWVG